MSFVSLNHGKVSFKLVTYKKTDPKAMPTATSVTTISVLFLILCTSKGSIPFPPMFLLCN